MDPSEFGFTDFYGEEPGEQSGAVDLSRPMVTGRGPDRPPQRPTQAQPQMTDKERRKAEAKHRIRLAGYYEAAQESELFEDMTDNYARQVQAEVAAFLEQRIEFLTGVGEPLTPAQFTPAEALVLKALAKRISEADPEDPHPTTSPPEPPSFPPPPPPPPPERRVAQAPAQSRPVPRKAPVAQPEPARATQAPLPVPAPPPAPPNAPKGRHGGPRKKGQKVGQPAPQAAPPAPPPPGRIPFPTGPAMSRAMELKAHEALASAQVVDTGTTEVKTR